MSGLGDEWMRLNVRDAMKRDLPQIMAIERLGFAHPWSMESFVRELALPFSRTIVASTTIASNASASGEGLVGYLCRWLVADECHVLNVAVHPELRRKGVALRLMSEAITEAKAKEAHLVTLEVRRSNVAARALYRKLNFEERRLRHNYYGPGEDAIVMELRLA